MALTKITGQVINDTTGLVVGVTTVGGGVSAVDGFFSGIVTFSNDVSIAGTLTYEDVTNVSSVGNITVGSGITLSKDGDIFFTGIMTGNGSGLTNLATDLVNDTTPQLGGNLDVNTKNITFGDSASASDDRLTFGAGTDLSIYHGGDQNYVSVTGTGNLNLTSGGAVVTKVNSTEDAIVCNANGSVDLYHDNSKKLETASGGVTVTGTVAATAYTGDGSALTGVSSPNLGATETQGYQNLKILTTANNSTVITCDSVLLANTSGVLVKVDSVNVTLDATGTGLNGLDTGSLAGEKFYYIWIINNGSTTGAIASLSSTSPTLPSGYTYKARVGGVATNIGSGTDLLLGQQINSTYMFARSESDIVKVTNGNGGQSATQFAVPNVSSLASDWTAFVKTSGATNAGTTHKFVFAGASGANDSDNRYARIWQMYHVTGNGIGDMNFQVPFIPVLTLSSGVPQAWLATNGSTGPNWYVYCTGFKY